MSDLHYTPADQLMINLDQAVRTLFGHPLVTERQNPSQGIDESDLNEQERDHAARLMRINHTGEVCAQALYQGQALTARDPATRAAMQESAAEENDHLEWCQQRVEELDGRLSLLNPLWYAGSFAMGATAGAIGDKWSLGFVSETERQVESHLEEHLKTLPAQDARSRAIVEQMKADEIEHGKKAREHGGVELPGPIKAMMKATSKIMTQSVYRI